MKKFAEFLRGFVQATVGAMLLLTALGVLARLMYEAARWGWTFGGAV